ncbi:unnamed protein product, partial [Prorocentrum cordatum]
MVRTTGLMSFKEHVAADISAHAGAHLSLVEFQAKEQMCFKLISWDAQGIAKHSAEYFAATLREQHDHDAAIFQEAGYWGKTTRLEVGEGDFYLVTPRVEWQKQMGLPELSDLITMAPLGACPIVGADARATLPPPPQADEERWIGDFPVGQRTRRAEMLTRFLMQRDLAAANTFTAAASGPACHCDFKRPPAQIDSVLRSDSAQSDHAAIKLESTLGTRRRCIWNGGRAPMKGWTCLDNRFQRWSHGACYAEHNPAPITSMADAVHLAAAACGRGLPARRVPRLPEGRELMQTLRMLEARRRVTRDRVQRAIYSEDAIRIRGKVWAANRALQHCLHEPGAIHDQPMNAEGGIDDDPLRIKELLERDYGSACRASDREELVGATACLAHFTTEDAFDIPPFSPEMLREALCDMKAMRAPGVGGVVAEVLQALDSGSLASLAAVFESHFRGVSEHASGQAWSKHIIQLMMKKGGKHALKGYRPIMLLTTFEKLYSVGLVKKCASSMGVTFSMRMMAEKARKWNIPISIMDGDIEAAFDRVSHRSVEETLRRRAVPGPVILAITRELKATAVITMCSIQTQPVPRTRGIRQGDLASAIPFNLVLEDAWEEFLGECRTRGRGCEFPGEATLYEAGLLYADILAVCGHGRVAAPDGDGLAAFPASSRPARTSLGFDLGYDGA